MVYTKIFGTYKIGGVKSLDEFNKEDFKGFNIAIWKRIFAFLSNDKKAFIILNILNIIIICIDVYIPLLTANIIKTIAEQKNIDNINIFLIKYFGVALLLCFFIYVFINIAGKLETNMAKNIRRDCFKKVQTLSYSYFDITPTGWIISRISSDATIIGDAIAWNFLDFVWGTGVIIFSFIVMFSINFKLSLYIFLLVPVVLYLSYYFQKKILIEQRKTRKINSKIVSYINESISGIKTTKTLVREQRNFEEFNILTNDMMTKSIKVSRLSAIYLPSIVFLSGVGYAIVIIKGDVKILDIATFSLFINYLTRIFEFVKILARNLIEVQKAQVSAERVFSLIDTKPAIVDSEEVIKTYGDQFNQKLENWHDLKGDIEFKDVSFYYKAGEEVLENFSLKVSPGEKIALVGETGSGKSTIVNLICRFYEPTSGQIFIDGKNYKCYSQSWLHSNLGYVLQTPHLFSGTIKDNIKYGKLNATDKEVVNASKVVDAYNFIMEFPNGFDTTVGEGGNKLSLGQKQLISFARAIIGNPKFFILDEATSSIDTQTEQIIQEASKKVLEGRTSFIIAHRLSTIRFCDKILVIKDGKILESGTHKQLISKKKYYYKLYTNQFAEEGLQIF